MEAKRRKKRSQQRKRNLSQPPEKKKGGGEERKKKEEFTLCENRKRSLRVPTRKRRVSLLIEQGEGSFLRRGAIFSKRKRKRGAFALGRRRTFWKL